MENEPALDKALKLLHDLQLKSDLLPNGRSLIESALEYLVVITDADRLYDVALGRKIGYFFIFILCILVSLLIFYSFFLL